MKRLGIQSYMFDAVSEEEPDAEKQTACAMNAPVW